MKKIFEGTIDPKNTELQTSGQYIIKIEDKQPMEGVRTCPICGKKIKAKGWAPHKKMHERAREKGNKENKDNKTQQEIKTETEPFTNTE